MISGRDATIYLYLYRLYILPIIEYGAVFYAQCSKYNIRLIESIQKRFTKNLYKRVHNTSLYPSYDVSISEFGLATLLDVHRTLDLKALCDLINNCSVPIFTVKFSSRVPNRIIIPSIQTSLFRGSFFHRAIINWNDSLKKRIRDPLG